MFRLKYILVAALALSGIWGAPVGAAAEVNPLLKQVYPDMKGKLQDLTQWTGKVLIVNFWASWCTPCIVEIPELLTFQRKHKDEVQIIGIGIDDPVKMANVIRTLNITYPVFVADPRSNQRLLAQWGDLRGVLPFTVLFTPEGRMFLRNTGPVTAELLESYLQELRSAKSSGKK